MMKKGDGLLEYALILTLVAITVIGILTYVGPKLEPYMPLIEQYKGPIMWVVAMAFVFSLWVARWFANSELGEKSESNVEPEEDEE
jgi:hypothetical protein